MTNFIKFFTTIIFVFVSLICCLGQDVTLYSQADVDAFDPNTTVINGFLQLNGSNSPDPITNLDNLSNLTFISGGLNIYNNVILTNLDGLSNLTSIGGFCSIRYNTALTNIDGLSNLTSIGEFLYMIFNTVLTNLDGFSNLTSIGEYLHIGDHAALTDCCGIRNLLIIPGAISGYFNLEDNPSECSSVDEVISLVCEELSISLINNHPCINANNGSVQVEVNGFDAGPFNYTWENTTSGETGIGISQSEFFTIENLAMGTYDITVSEPNQDPVIETGIVLSEEPGSIFEIIEITTTNSSNTLSNGSFVLTTSGGIAPYSYNWLGQSSGSGNNINDNSYNVANLSQGIYDITVSDNVGNGQIVSVNLLDETVPVFPCEQPLDIVILSDVSGSVDAIEYTASKQFFVDFLNEMNIGVGIDDNRAAIIEWSSSDQQSIKIPITGIIADLQNYVNMNRSFNNNDVIDSAMNFGKDYLDNAVRPNAEKVLILSTDAFQVSPSIIALADQFKAEGYHIITIAFDNAFFVNEVSEILRQVASTDFLAPRAPTYPQLDQNLAQNIINLYFCPIDSGNSITAYFNRDGEIEITDIQPVGSCPTPDAVEITFTVEAKQELPLLTGTSVSFYYNNPELFGSTAILTWLIPCAIPEGTTETFTVTLPVSTAANIYAVLNDDGSQTSGIAFPITDIEELIYTNNTDNMSVCTGPLATIQALKYTTTYIPICNDTVIYIVNVCNVSDVDAFGVTVTDDAPDGFILQGMIVNDNGCTTDNDGNYDIPASCCVSITYTYNASTTENGYYNDQDVILGGPGGQTYINFDGSSTTTEDVIIDGSIDCPSEIINFEKNVNTTDICETGFVVYTFTIDNPLNVPLQGIQFTDVLPSPVNWTIQPYNLQGLTISTSSVSGNTASFIIDEVDANTVATFSMDANLGDWDMDGMLSNTATLENVPDLTNGGFQTLTSNTTSTNVYASPNITLEDTIYITIDDLEVELDATLNGATYINWTTTGDGLFDSTNSASTTYTLGALDFTNEEVSLFIFSASDCGESAHQVVILITSPPCEFTKNDALAGDCNDNGTPNYAGDDTYEVTVNADVINNDGGEEYYISDGTNIFGPFIYTTVNTITMPADGNIYTLTFYDANDNDCFAEVEVSQESCSTTASIELNGKTLDYSIFPNPTNENFQIEITGNTAAVDIQIYNSIGQKILEMEMLENAFIHTNIWARGVYSVVIYNKNGAMLGVEKILKIE